ncbi:alpha-ketoglutarate-dependent dioxygenase AlkB [Flavobacteriales bacterium 34_180_T64]|nr:alpha-ketoglutarate-dependent dioxygenase AlkB [Flavobacteriales bacterium 34_180_T64]
MDLFSNEKRVLKLPNAEVIYVPNFFALKTASNYFKIFKERVAWQQDDIKIFGKTYKQPRLTALYSINNQSYSYSGITMFPNAFTPELIQIKETVEKTCSHEFNSVLLNYYRNGNDSNGWHADNEKELGTHPVIASISFGEPRYFHFKHRELSTKKHKLLLEHGSLLIMKGEMQQFWLHQIAKTKQQIGGRINLTFRNLKPL